MYPTLATLLHPGHGFWHDLPTHWLFDHGLVLLVAVVALAAAAAWLRRGPRSID